MIFKIEILDYQINKLIKKNDYSRSGRSLLVTTHIQILFSYSNFILFYILKFSDHFQRIHYPQFPVIVLKIYRDDFTNNFSIDENEQIPKSTIYKIPYGDQLSFSVPC